jgi:hypothetical protein
MQHFGGEATPVGLRKSQAEKLVVLAMSVSQSAGERSSSGTALRLNNSRMKAMRFSPSGSKTAI